MRIVVDFPAPLGPRKPMISPRATVKLTSFTAVTPANVFTRFETAMAVGSWSEMDTTGAARLRYPTPPLIWVSLLKCHLSSPESPGAAALVAQKEGSLVVDSDHRARVPPPPLKHRRAAAAKDIEAVPHVGKRILVPALCERLVGEHHPSHQGGREPVEIERSSGKLIRSEERRVGKEG